MARNVVRKLTVMSEIKEVWQFPAAAVCVTRVEQLGVGIPQLIEKRVYHGVNGREALGRSVLQKPGDEVDRVGVGFSKDLPYC